MNKTKRLSNIIGLYLLLCFIVFVAFIIILTFLNTQNTVDNEIRRSFEQRHNIAEIIINQRLDKIDQILQDIGRDNQFLSTFIAKDSSLLKDLLLNINYNYSENRLDILFCMTYKNEQIANASSRFYNTDMLIPALYSEFRDFPNIPGINHHTFFKILKINNYTVLMKYSPIVNKKTGQELGMILGGTIVNENLLIIKEIKEITDVEAVYLLSNNQIIAASDLPDSTTREIFVKHDFSQKKASLYRDSGFIYEILDFSLNAEKPLLDIAFLISDSSLQQLFYAYIPSVFIILVLLIVVTAILIQLIRRLISTSLNPLLKYSAEISAGNYNTRFKKSSIIEFNELGLAMEGMVENLKKSNINLQKEITDRKRIEKEKEKIQEQLNQSQKMETVGTLAGGLAHDFNNILGAIIGSVQVINYNMKSNNNNYDQIKEDIETIEISAEMGKQVVTRLLALARKQTLSFVPVEITEIMENVIKICKNTFDKCVDFNFKKPVEEFVINGDQNHLEQIFLNIMVNASHAMTIMKSKNETHGGVITIQIKKITADESIAEKYKKAVSGKNYVVIQISDTGVGMSSNILSQIFNPFFTTKDKTNGTGLGLSMTYNIIEQHEGFIQVESQINAGSTFSIYLPISGKRQDIVSRSKASIITEGSELVLVIDDEKGIRKTMEKMLKICGYNVLLADNPIDGISLYKSKTDIIDLVILDMSMPKKSGYETFLELVQINKDVKVLLASGFEQDKQVQKLIKLGVNDFMHKPFTIDILSTKIAKILKK